MTGKTTSRRRQVLLPHFGLKPEFSPDGEFRADLGRFFETEVCHAPSTHDSQVLGELVDPKNSSGEVWADSAYQSEAIVEELTGAGYRPRIQRKGH